MHLQTIRRGLAALVLASGLVGCSTVKAMWGEDANPRPYCGVRSMMNADAVEAETILWPVDFVLSGIADTLLLPWTMGSDQQR